MKRRYFTNILLNFAAMAGCLLFAWTANAALIDQPMTGATAPGWVLGGTPASASLTGNGAIDPVGDGWLRLTNNTGTQAGYAYYNTPISLSQGALIQFDYVTWGGTGADGYTMFLFDASVPTFNIGASGGSLGYAQKDTPLPGISGGYIGIGVDEFGNFSNPTEGRYLGPGARPNTVTIRGPVSPAAPPTGGTQGTQSYPWIATSANNGALWANQATRPTPTSADYRRVVMRISPAPSPLVDVWIQFGYNQPLTQMISGAAIGTAPPASLKLGYAASTGGSTNYHEIRNLVVEPSGVAASINLGMSKTASAASIAVGSPITYTVIARNYGPNNITANGVGISDTVPAQISGVTWNCAATGGAACGAASGSGNSINTTANLPFNGAVTYTISGTLTSYPGASLANTASLTVPGGITDYRASDNSTTVTIPVTAASLDLGITKTTPATNSLLGDTIIYTVIARNNGPASAYNVGVADTIPAELTGVTWTCTPSVGATCANLSGSGNSLNTTVHLPLNGTATYTITGTLSSLPGGGTLSNTASLVIPAGYTDTNAANNSATATSTVAGSTPGSGNKPLYLYGAAGYQLSRTPTPGTPGYVEITRGANRLWTENPVLQLPVTISNVISPGGIPVLLNIAADNATRTFTATLYCSSAPGTFLTSPVITATGGTTITPYSLTIPFTVPIPSMTCANPNAWVVRINHTGTVSGTRYIRVYPVNGASISNITLPSQNVININNSDITFYSATYNGGSALASINNGQTVYIRASVSDPFGSYDISGATITLKDSTGTVRVASTAMTQVQDSGAATKIFEFAYTVPAAGPAGNWSAQVVASEGSEGTVSDSAQAVMPVVIALPNVFILKSADKASASPGEVITYTIQVKNDGAGPANAVTLTDSLGKYNALAISPYAGSPFSFSPLSSGLTLGTPVYSSDGGATYAYPALVSGAGGAPAGYDGLVTNWKIIMNNIMNGNGGNFTLNYRVIVK